MKQTLEDIREGLATCESSKACKQFCECWGHHPIRTLVDEIDRLKVELERLERWKINVAQDDCEGAFVPVTSHDTLRHALHELNPDHPILKEPCPSFGVWESQRNTIAELRVKLGEANEIVCICGSSRFAGRAAVRQWEYAKEGILALGMHLLPDWYFGDVRPDDPGHVAEREGVADILDELHLRKIDMADRVFVVNVGGYIGERTRFEINHANERGIPVEYMVPIETEGG